MAEKHGRTLSKVIRSEAMAEKQALEVAIKQLGEIQRIQKEAVKVCLQRSPERQMLTRRAGRVPVAYDAIPRTQ